MAKQDWIWMPHPGHLIVSQDCRFHLNTFIPAPPGIYSPAEALAMLESDTANEDDVMSLLHVGVIVSTVGEWLPDEPIRERLAAVQGIQLTGKGDARLADFLTKVGFPEIGAGRTYETMVFRAQRPDDEPSCCPYRQADGGDLDMRGYNDPAAACAGHHELCCAWDARLTAMKPTTRKE